MSVSVEAVAVMFVVMASDPVGDKYWPARKHFFIFLGVGVFGLVRASVCGLNAYASTSKEQDSKGTAALICFGSAVNCASLGIEAFGASVGRRVPVSEIGAVKHNSRAGFLSYLVQGLGVVVI